MVITEEHIREVLETVHDPEIPTISIVDLGIVTGIEILDENKVKVTLTPTFSGCPALKIMEDLVKEALFNAGIPGAEVETSFAVQWTSDMITPRGLEAIKKHGIAAPERSKGYHELPVLQNIECPFCGSRNTTMQSPFGPTLCRALHYCNNCLQAFEQFKPVI